MEIVCLGSSLQDYDHLSWKIGREYNARFIHDVEIGLKNWETFNPSIDPTCWAFAKQYVSPFLKGNLFTPLMTETLFPPLMKGNSFILPQKGIVFQPLLKNVFTPKNRQ